MRGSAACLGSRDLLCGPTVCVQKSPAPPAASPAGSATALGAAGMLLYSSMVSIVSTRVLLLSMVKVMAVGPSPARPAQTRSPGKPGKQSALWGCHASATDHQLKTRLNTPLLQRLPISDVADTRS